MKLPVMVLHMSIPHIFRRKDWFRNFLAKVEWEDDWPVVNPGVGMLEKERYTGQILGVGISYDKDTKEHHCKIEQL